VAIHEPSDLPAVFITQYRTGRVNKDTAGFQQGPELFEQPGLQLNGFLYLLRAAQPLDFGVTTNHARCGAGCVQQDPVESLAILPGAGIQDIACAYFFDENLVSNPPPHFLQIDQPVFAAYRQVRGAGRHAVSGEVSWNLRGVTIGLTPPLDVGELLEVGVEIGEGGIGAEVGVGGINVGVGIGGGSGINIDLGLGGR
jgi:hypothetical protein